VEVRVEFKNTVGELIAFSWAHAFRSPWMYLVFSFWAYSWLSPATDAWSAWSCIRCTVKYYAIFTTLIVVSFLAFSTIIALLMFISKGHRESLAPRKLIVSPAGVIEETEYSRNEHKWPAILRVLRTKRFVALYIAPNLAYVIPRRTVRSDEEWKLLNQLANEAKQT
jgi:hypothetical protein